MSPKVQAVLTVYLADYLNLAQLDLSILDVKYYLNVQHVNIYRSQRSCGKVMFLHLCVILFTGGICPGVSVRGVSLSRGVSVQWGSLSGGVSIWGVSVQGGGLC